MPRHMFHLMEKGLARAGKEVKGAKLALLGWAFLANTDDARNTPAEPFLELCKASGADIRVHDPWVTEWPGIDISQDLESVLSGADAVIIFTGHRMYYQLDPHDVRKLS